MPHLPERVEEPVDESLDVVFATFRLNEALKVIVAIALGRHRPELADDRHLGFGAKAIDLDCRQMATAAPKRLQYASVVLERVADFFFHGGDRSIGRSFFDFVGPDAIAENVQHVAGEEPTGQRHEELGVQHQADLLASRLLEAGLLLEENHSESIEPSITKGLPVLGDIHAEPAGAAGAGGQEDVAVDDLLRGHPFFVS